MAFHATGLINLGLSEMAHDDLSSSLVAFLPNVNNQGLGKITQLRVPEPNRHSERNHGHQVFVSPEASKGIQAEVSRSSRVNGRDVETGGLMFGEIDDSLGLLYLDCATGPPPDSFQSPQLFLCGTDGTHERSEVQKLRSGGAVSLRRDLAYTPCIASESK